MNTYLQILAASTVVGDTMDLVGFVRAQETNGYRLLSQ
jgi:hypothetical protein